MLAFIQTRPPRMTAEKWSVPLASGKLRAFNLWILRRASVQTNTFPSATWRLPPREPCPPASWPGVGRPQLPRSRNQYRARSRPGRYHYAADAILGFVVARAALLAGATLARVEEGC
jgi:hypothetical protein